MDAGGDGMSNKRTVDGTGSESPNKKMKYDDDVLDEVIGNIPGIESINLSNEAMDMTSSNLLTPVVSVPATPAPIALVPEVKSSAPVMAGKSSSTNTAPIMTPGKKQVKLQGRRESLKSGPGPNGASGIPGKDESNDPDKLSDAILAAGIDLKAEESFLLVSNQNKFTTSNASGSWTPAKIRDLKQFGGFMNKVLKENALNQLSTSKLDTVELVQLACDQFLTDIVTNAIIMSRHRRRPMKTKKSSSSSHRSEISRALRDLAIKDKEAEEKRMEKRAALGLDTGDGSGDKAGAEETLHRAANATAAMMMAGSKKKKYSWMTGSNNANGAAGASQLEGSTNPAIAARGDTGIRYREAREEPGVALRDLVAALETKRMGVDRALTKAYTKL